MSVIGKAIAPNASGDFVRSAKPARTRTTISPLTLRLTSDERTRLEELADGTTLSAYVRACVFAEGEWARNRRPKDPAADRKAAADALVLSRIASNFNQLAYHANIGMVIVGEAETAEIAEANGHLQAIRGLLMRGLGKTA
ncbi:MAG: hypothetical protein AAGE03_15955 [Pseudomonadota bacterium]